MITTFGNIVRKARGRVLLQVVLTVLAVAITALPTSAQSAQGQKATAGTTAPSQLVCPANGQCFADVTSSSSFYDFVNRIYLQGLVSGYACGGPGEPCDSENRPYYRPGADVTRQQMSKFIDNARHLAGIAISASSTAVPVYVYNSGADAIQGTGVITGSAGVRGTSTYGYGLQGTSAGAAGINGYNTGAGFGVEGYSVTGYGVRGYGDANDGVYGRSNGGANTAGVFGTSNSGYGVQGTSTGNYGVYGYGAVADGVHGLSAGGPGTAGINGASINGEGAVGVSTNDVGVYAESNTGSGLYAKSMSGYAGYFVGDIYVTGNCTGCLGPSKIDDPLDPTNKYLYQSPVQSDDYMSVYNGNVTTDANGDAVVSLPDYFEALNKDYRYQLTVMGQFAQAIVADGVKNNKFTIKTDKPNVAVSWQVTGIRQDPYTNATRVTGEQDKPSGAQGTYVHPVQLGQPASKGENYEQSQLYSK